MFKIKLPLSYCFEEEDGNVGGVSGDGGSQEPTEANTETQTDTSNPDNAGQDTEGNNNEPAESKTLSQEEVDRIVQDRLARERKKFEGIDPSKIKKLEETAGMPLDQIVDQVEQQQRQQQAQQYANQQGVPYEVAQKMLESDNKYQTLEQKLQQMEQQQFNNQQRAELKNNPQTAKHFQKYQDEIENAVGMGADVKTAYNYVIGQHINEILSEYANASQQKAAADFQKQQNKKVEGASEAADDDGVQIPKDLKDLAKFYDVPVKNIAKRYKKQEQQ